MAYRARSSVRRLRLVQSPRRAARIEHVATIEAATESPDVHERLNALSYNELRAIATERGVDSTGKKHELVERIASAGYQ